MYNKPNSFLFTKCNFEIKEMRGQELEVLLVIVELYQGNLNLKPLIST